MGQETQGCCMWPSRGAVERHDAATARGSSDVNQSHLSYANDYSFKDTDALEFLHWIQDASHAEGMLYAWRSVSKATTIIQGDNDMPGVTSAAYDAFQ